jgi:hypothetical protein
VRFLGVFFCWRCSVVKSLEAGRTGGFWVGCDGKGHAVIFFLSRRENRGQSPEPESRPLAPGDAALGLVRKRHPLLSLFHEQVESRFTNSALCKPVTRWLATSPAPLFLMTTDDILNQTVLPLSLRQQIEAR